MTPGNQFWKLRSRHGRKKLFETPELLWKAACEYFQWCQDNPWYKTEQIRQPGKGYKDSEGEYHPPELTTDIPTDRPFTIQGLCLYLDCNTVYFNQFEKALKGKEDELSVGFSQIVLRIRETIYQQKFEGAAVGAFNASIIARDLGLRDKVDTEVSGKDGNPIETKTIVTLNLG